MRAKWVHLLISGAMAGAVPAPNHAASMELKPAVAAWLNAQTNITSWSADFVQTRRLKSLTGPLTAQGHVWFKAPNRFRWELGQPPQTIAVRAPSEMLIYYPKLKRVERFPLAGARGRWREALALLEAGFPRSQSELEARYHLLSQTVTNQTGQVVLQPKSRAARRMIPRIGIEFDARSLSLRGTELEFGDGSTMRNDFQHPRANLKVPDHLFAPGIPPDYKIVEPLNAPGQ